MPSNNCWNEYERAMLDMGGGKTPVFKRKKLKCKNKPDWRMERKKEIISVGYVAAVEPAAAVGILIATAPANSASSD
jgi:hypothetical protein